MGTKMKPYTAEQQRVADYIVEISQNMIGGGEDPIGFIIASHRVIAERLRKAGLNIFDA